MTRVLTRTSSAASSARRLGRLALRCPSPKLLFILLTVGLREFDRAGVNEVEKGAQVCNLGDSVTWKGIMLTVWVLL